jgi:cytosine/uracil/thiamine/allantoin permease
MDRAPEMGESDAERPFGPVAAVFLAAGIGAVVLGLMTVLAEASTSIHDALELSTAVGPLSGKTIAAAAAFFISWAILHAAIKDRDYEPRKVFIWSGILVILGLAMTFPPIFLSFTVE